MDWWYIKIHRKILEWEWYDDINTYRLFTHLLFKANYEDQTWHWIEIKRGQRLTSLYSLSKETGLSIQQIRTSINKLKSTHEITQSTTSTFTLITLINYDKYQSNQHTEQQTSNTRATHNKEREERKEDIRKENIKEKKIKKEKVFSLIEKIKNERKEIKEIIQNLYPIQNQTITFFFERIINKWIKLEDETETIEEYIEKINNKLDEIFKLKKELTDEKFTEELIKFIDWHAEKWTLFKSTIGRLNTWFLK